MRALSFSLIRACFVSRSADNTTAAGRADNRRIELKAKIPAHKAVVTETVNVRTYERPRATISVGVKKPTVKASIKLKKPKLKVKVKGKKKTGGSYD